MAVQFGGPFFVGVLIIRALLFRVCISAPDFFGNSHIELPEGGGWEADQKYGTEAQTRA